MGKPTETISKPESCPSVHVKRERSEDDGEEETRRVAQRTAENEIADASTGTPEGATGDAVDVVAPITECVKTISKSDDKNAVKDAMEKLVDGLFEQEQRAEKQQAFLHAGGPITVVNAMQKHEDDELIQRRGIEVLMNATYRDKDNKLRSVIAEMDGLEAIIAAMTNHPTKLLIQQNGVMALYNLSFLEQNAEKLVLKLEIIPLVIKTMSTFSNDAGVVREACFLLWKLSEYEKLRKPMKDANVVSALAKSIDGHKNNQEIQERACKAMKRLM